jgi:subtilase family serine protease
MLPNNFTLRMQLVFGIRSPNAFQACSNAINEPKSPYYHRFLNAITLEPYIPTPGQKQSVISFLQTLGFNLNVPSSQRATVYYDWTVPNQPSAYTIRTR